MNSGVHLCVGMGVRLTCVFLVSSPFCCSCWLVAHRLNPNRPVRAPVLAAVMRPASASSARRPVRAARPAWRARCAGLPTPAALVSACRLARWAVARRVVAAPPAVAQRLAVVLQRVEAVSMLDLMAAPTRAWTLESTPESMRGASALAPWRTVEPSASTWPPTPRTAAAVATCVARVRSATPASARCCPPTAPRARPAVRATSATRCRGTA